MSNVYYLRPPGQKSSQPAPEAGARHLRVALSAAHLAAALRRSSSPRAGKLPPDVESLAWQFADAPNPASGSKGRLRQKEEPAAVRPRRSALSAAHASGFLPGNVFVVAEVLAGKVRFDPAASSNTDLGRSLLRLRSEFIGVPDDILLARQERTGAVAFSIASLDDLGEVVSGLIGSQRHMIESWAFQGARPGIRFRYQAARPFGRVAHVGASEATDLRALGVQMSSERQGHDRFYVVELSLTHR